MFLVLMSAMITAVRMIEKMKTRKKRRGGGGRGVLPFCSWS